MICRSQIQTKGAILQLFSQVLDSDLGWTGFRPYDSETWAWVSAALRPRFLLSSGSMSEASLVRVSGQMG